MMVEQTQHSPPRPSGSATVPPSQPTPAKSSMRWVLPLILVVLVAAIGAGWWFLGRGGTAQAAEGARPKNTEAIAPLVEVATPVSGGLPRTVSQPGTLQPFQQASLYAKVSGYLETLNVDYGDRVKKGDLLVEIDDPEIHKAVEQARAALAQAKASVKTAEARINTAKADAASARADLAKAEADVKEFTAKRVYRASELDRYRRLARDRSIEQKLVDEEEERYGSAVAAEEAAQANVKATRAKIDAAEARVEQSKADLLEAQANQEAAQADLEKAEVLAGYTRITSPYDGVITERNYFPGAFIRSATEGATTPLLVVARTDKFRVGVMVPDLDVPYVDKGDPATVHINALPHEEFHAQVARFSESETENERNMYTEIDLENAKGELRAGMYGDVTLILEPANPKAVTIPSGGLIERNSKGKGAVYTVRDSKIHRQEVRIGRDNGVQVEILEGLRPEAQVVVRYNGSIADGMTVKAEPARTAVQSTAREDDEG